MNKLQQWRQRTGRAYKAKCADVIEATRSRPLNNHEWPPFFAVVCASRVHFRRFSCLQRAINFNKIYWTMQRNIFCINCLSCHCPYTAVSFSIAFETSRTRSVDERVGQFTSNFQKIYKMLPKCKCICYWINHLTTRMWKNYRNCLSFNKVIDVWSRPTNTRTPSCLPNLQLSCKDISHINQVKQTNTSYIVIERVRSMFCKVNLTKYAAVCIHLLKITSLQGRLADTGLLNLSNDTTDTVDVLTEFWN